MVRDDDALPQFQAVDAFTQPFNRADDLVSQDRRSLQAVALQFFDIAAADAAELDLKENFAGPDFGQSQLFDFDAIDGGTKRRFHDC
jgi:hypothetical protein